jgi:insulysin
MEQLIKSPNDDRNYFTFELNNKLRVFLINDKKSSSSCVAMSVKIGYKNDTVSGLAHFLEHMLFLGTKKYPNDSYFHDYVQQNSGGTNAYTSYDHTCYFYTIQHKSLFESLDIFSQFFINPLLSKESIIKEINAVDSEYIKDINEEPWRILEVLRTGCYKDHSFSRFGSGNKNTLNLQNIHELTKQFFENYYSSDLMTLIILTNKELNDVNMYVNNIFSKITIKPKHVINKLRDTGNILEVPKLYYVVPLKNNNKIMFFWEVPVVNSKYSPIEFILHLIDNESIGSINYILKQHGYLSNLSSNIKCHTKDKDVIQFILELSESGLKNIDYVVKVFMNYIELIKSNIESEYMIKLYQEFYKIKTIKFVYQDKVNPEEYVLDLMSGYIFNDVKPKNLLVFGIIKKRFSEIKNLMLNILNTFNLDNLIVMCISKIYENIATQKVNYYDTKYVTSMDKFKNIDVNDKLILMPLNKYISENYSFIKEKEHSKPIKIIDSDGLLVFHKIDFQFKNPLTCIKVRIDIPKIMSNLKTFLCGILYFDCIINQMYPELYMCSLSGYDFTIDCNDNRIYILIKGFSDKIMSVCDYIVNSILSKNITDNTFNSVRYAMKINDTNNIYDQPYIKTIDIFNKKVLKKYYNYDDRLSIIDSITKSDILESFDNVMSSSCVTMLVCGNTNIQDTINISKIFKKLIIKDVCVIESKNTVNSFSSENIIETNKNVSDVNNALACYFPINKIIIGEGNWNIDLCLINVLDKLITSKYFNYMRTKHNFGYIASASSGSCGDSGCETYYVKFITQSPNKSLDEIFDKNKSFYIEFKNNLISIKDKKITDIINGCVSVLQYPYDNITEMTEYYFKQIENQYYNFDMKEILIQTYEKINKVSIINFYNKYIVSNKTTLSIGIKSK